MAASFKVPTKAKAEPSPCKKRPKYINHKLSVTAKIKLPIAHDNIAKTITKNEQLISAVNKRMPEEIKKCIKHIELSR